MNELLKDHLVRRFGPGCSWLDVGAGDGSVSKELAAVLRPSHFTCLDLEACHKPGLPQVHAFSGHGIDLVKRPAVDFVLFNYVLYLAGEKAPSLLLGASFLSDTLVIQEELLSEDAATLQKQAELHPEAEYRTAMGWRHFIMKLFNAPHRVEGFLHPEPNENLALFFVNFDYKVPTGPKKPLKKLKP